MSVGVGGGANGGSVGEPREEHVGFARIWLKLRHAILSSDINRPLLMRRRYHFSGILFSENNNNSSTNHSK